MLLGVIADDFTGAGDIANTLTKGLPRQGGLRVVQYMGVPRRAANSAIQAGVIALKTRSVAPSDAVRQSLAALDWLQQQGCRQFVFKYCSTFDSTAEGNIGPVGEALADALGVAGVIVCPAFPQAGRTVHQGHLFVQDRLLHESGMQNHPLTPMTDANIRRWLERQTKSPVGLVPVQTVRFGATKVKAALNDAAGRGETLVIADAATEADLITLARACAEAPLVTGGSGIAIGLPANFIACGLATGKTPSFSGIAGPEALLAGSCSAATRGQIAVHAKGHPVLALSAADVMGGNISLAGILAFLHEHRGRKPLVYSSGVPEEVAAAQRLYGSEALASRLDALFAAIARQAVASGVTRLIVAGGETSGAVAQALNLDEFSIGPEIDPGVPILFNHAHGIALALKSGNFGRSSFFEHAADALEGKM